MGTILKKIKGSIRTQIGILYSILALANIIFFSVMIFENQSDLLLNNFKFHSENIIKTVVNDLKDFKLTKVKDTQLDGIVAALKVSGINSFQIFDAKGILWHEYPDTGNSEKEVSASLKARILDLLEDASVFKSKYKLEFDEKDFSVNFILPLRGKLNEELFLSTNVSIEIIRTRLQQLYYQIGLAVAWGIIFHFLFGIFLYRVIFVRVSALKSVTAEMAGGNLHARAGWKFENPDELDDLGSSFNQMAEKIEETVDTVTKLNKEIQNELEIGKEVQELFLPKMKGYENFNIDVWYRPLREVSGDIYQFCKLHGDSSGKNEIGVFFADASGHGVSAALVTTVTLLSLEAILHKVKTPAHALSELSKVLSERFVSSFFATSIFISIDSKGILHYANAGHNPQLVVRPQTGEIFHMPSDGPPLGMDEEFSYPSRTIQTLSGDKILIYSDGLVETKNRDKMQFGLDRVEETLIRTRNLSTKQILDAIKDDFTGYIDHYKDDVSVILLEIP
ncbi:MAG: SpoIIE family protein phosphatase [Leptospira sp.]|nr:SpoIIE family protein phosphatase [Leptospira sp.]